MVETHVGDCVELMRKLPAKSVDLVFGSPPYEDARTYGIDFKLKGQAWVDWMLEVVKASLHVSKGLVAFVVEGRTRNYQWTATPALLMADLHRAGITIRKPPLYVRHGIPGSGGPDWLKNRYEFIVCATNGGKLPWSDNTACGHDPLFPPGGAPSHRGKNGNRKTFAVQTRRASDGSCQIANDADKQRPLPEKANPGNLIDCGANTHFGLGNENEAPFPEKLAEFFVKSFCPPGGIVLDPFSGSGTTAKAAAANGRRAIAIDLRESQIELTTRRVATYLDPIFS
jgi:16S rRNA G966 N2-methylase RsmD